MKCGFLLTILFIFHVQLIFADEVALKLFEEIDNAVQEKEMDAEIALNTKLLLAEAVRPYLTRLTELDQRNLTNPLLKRQLEILKRASKYPKLNSQYRQVRLTLQSVGKQRWSCQRNSTSKCNLAFVPHIKSIITQNDDLKEIKYYWQDWRAKIPKSVKNALLSQVLYYLQMSTATLKPSEIWYEDFETSNFIEELQQVMEDISPLYRQLHAHIRHVLHQKYGEEVVNATGLIPAHLMESVTYQAWKKESIMMNPFPQRPLPNLQADINDQKLKHFDLVKMSQSYFGYLGFENMTSDFMEQHFIPMTVGGPDCHSRLVEFGNVELHYCPKVHYKRLMQTHGELARFYYALSKKNMTRGLNEEACPGFANAIGEAIILSVSNPTHLQKCLNLLSDFDYDDFLNLNRLYRMAIHTLLTLPTYFVHEKLWVDIIDGNVPVAQINTHYWELMEKWIGVGSPVEPQEGVYDMPYKFYEGTLSETSNSRKFFGEILGYQIHRDICLRTGLFERGNPYKTLNFCDFDQSPESGEYLSNLMGAGSTKPWRELISTLTVQKTDRLSASALLEYFEPVHNWLINDNLKKQLFVGW